MQIGQPASHRYAGKGNWLKTMVSVGFLSVFEKCHLRPFNRENITLHCRFQLEINRQSSQCVLKRLGLSIQLNLQLSWQCFSKVYVIKRKLIQSLNRSKNSTEKEGKKMFLPKDTTQELAKYRLQEKPQSQRSCSHPALPQAGLFISA